MELFAKIEFLRKKSLNVFSDVTHKHCRTILKHQLLEAFAGRSSAGRRRHLEDEQRAEDGEDGADGLWGRGCSVRWSHRGRRARIGVNRGSVVGNGSVAVEPQATIFSSICFVLL